MILTFLDSVTLTLTLTLTLLLAMLSLASMSPATISYSSGLAILG